MIADTASPEEASAENVKFYYPVQHKRRGRVLGAATKRWTQKHGQGPNSKLEQFQTACCSVFNTLNTFSPEEFKYASAILMENVSKVCRKEPCADFGISTEDMRLQSFYSALKSICTILRTITTSEDFRAALIIFCDMFAKSCLTKDSSDM